MKPRMLSASTLTGDKVRSPQGEDLGKVEEFMLDLDEGRIAYVVLSMGGVLGMGDRLLAIPWAALRLQPEEHAFVLDVDRDLLKNAEGFSKDRWPDGSDMDWLARVYRYFGQEPYWEHASTAGKR